MPQMGISVAEGTITEWRKRPGDWVDADEVICEVTTDKVDVEIPAPAAGRVEKLLAEPGDTVAVGEPLAEIDPAARPGEAHPEESSDRSGAGPVAAGPPSDRAPQSARSEVGPATPPAHRPSEVDRSGFHSPVVQRIASEHGIDLSKVPGTGVGGRVRKTDVLAFVDSGGEGKAPGGRPLHTESPYRAEPEPAANGAGAPSAEAQAPSEEAPAAPERREPMSPMRQQIAHHMVESRNTSAHCTTIVEADFSKVAARRAELR
ncbi:MAG: biotin/lipoyl-containing protein, partial [Solirubrobacterales bacterium]